MIDLTLESTENIDKKFQLLGEGILGDIIQSTSGVDTGKLQSDLAGASTPSEKINVVSKASKSADEGLRRNVRDATKNYGVKGKSIVARAKNSILQFPIYVTQSIRVNEAQIISKTFERVYATLVQTVLAQNPIIDSEDDINGLTFLQNFHTNISESTNHLVNNFYEAIDDFDKIMCESVFYAENLNSNISVEFKLIPTVNEDLIAENIRLTNDPLNGFNELILEAIPSPSSTSSSYDVNQVPEDEFARMLNKYKALGIPDAPNSLAELKEKIKRGELINGDPIKDSKEQIVHYKVIGNRAIYYTGVLKNKISPSKAIDSPMFLKDTDIKKINGMLPYTIEATFRVKSTGTDVRFIIGIKSIMHLINPQDLSDDLKEIIMGNERTLQKVRYKTGELSFKDYYFNIKGIKADAAKHINYNKRWINTLKRLGEYKKLVGPAISDIAKLVNGNYPIPNGTLILSHTDVIKLKNDTGIDLNMASNVRRLAKSLFLIAFVIIDITSSTMKVLFPDETSEWDIQSLASLDAEVSKMDNSQLMKELNRLVNK